MKGVLLVNLGSPDTPEPADVKNYLREFLMDERVIDFPYFVRSLLVKGIILNISKNTVDSFLAEIQEGENFNKFIVIKDSKDGPQLTWVKIGVSDLSNVEILSGLKEDDSIFILPSKSLFDYQKRFKERVQASFSFG